MNFQQLLQIQDDLIRLRGQYPFGSDTYNKCNEALKTTEDLMVDMMSASHEENSPVFKHLVNEVESLFASVFCPLGDK
jgi:hypothetical protein